MQNRRGDAPKALAHLSRSGVPVRAILLATVFGYASVIMSYVSPDTVFAFLVNSYGTVAIFVCITAARSSGSSVSISVIRFEAMQTAISCAFC